jgi:hypothetical protein
MKMRKLMNMYRKWRFGAHPPKNCTYEEYANWFRNMKYCVPSEERFKARLTPTDDVSDHDQVK